VHQISDAAAYRLFTQKIVDEGVFDFSLVGCMGQSIVSTPVYLLTGSPYHYNITSAILFVLSVLLMFKTASLLYDRKAGIAAAVIFSTMPIFYEEIISGMSTPGIAFMAVLCLYLYVIESKLLPLCFWVSLTFKPFLFALFPLVILARKKGTFYYLSWACGLCLLGLYFYGSYLDSGKIYNVWSQGSGCGASLSQSITTSAGGYIKNMFRFVLDCVVVFDYTQWPVYRAIVSPIVVAVGCIEVVRLRQKAFLWCFALGFFLYILPTYSFIRYAMPLFCIAIIAASPLIVRSRDLILSTVVTTLPLWYFFIKKIS